MRKLWLAVLAVAMRAAVACLGAQAQLILLAVAMAAVTRPAAKPQTTEARVNALTASGLLLALSQQSSPSDVGATSGGFATFGGATDGVTLKANINAAVGYINSVAGDVANLAARENQIYAIMRLTGLWA